MARGRMITNEIAKDKIVNNLSCDTCRLFFTWLIPFADVDGRVLADPDLLKAGVFPRRRDVSIEDIEGYLVELHNAGLLIVYGDDSELYAWFPSFEKNQTGLRKDREPQSRIPAQPILDDCGKYPDDYWTVSGCVPDYNRIISRLREVKLKEVNIPKQQESEKNSFSVFEENIGPLTPVVSDELQEAEKEYTFNWVRDAIKESALHNKRNMKYILAILKNRRDGKTKDKKRQSSESTEGYTPA